MDQREQEFKKVCEDWGNECGGFVSYFYDEITKGGVVEYKFGTKDTFYSPVFMNTVCPTGFEDYESASEGLFVLITQAVKMAKLMESLKLDPSLSNKVLGETCFERLMNESE